jgi:hypothetical protein
MIEAIEARAEAVLERVPSWIWDGESLPVPVEDIADSCFNLLVREAEDLSAAPGAPELGPDQSLSGLLLPAWGEIWVNADEAARAPARKRFTICHELGHWCMHRDGGRDERAVFCRSATVGPDAAGGPDMEEQAQIFAAAMLMPAHLVREHYKPGMDFWGFCDRFGSSGQAMGRRLHRVID